MSPQKQALTLLDKQQTLFLSTQHPTGRLETSVTPFVIYEGCFYIFVRIPLQVNFATVFD